MYAPKLQIECQLWSLIGLDNGHSSCNKNGLFRLIPWIPTWRGRYEMCAVRASSHAWMRVRRSHGRQCRGGGRPTLLSHVALFPLFIAHHCCVSTRHICTASRVYIAFGFTPSNNVCGAWLISWWLLFRGKLAIWIISYKLPSVGSDVCAIHLSK